MKYAIEFWDVKMGNPPIKYIVINSFNLREGEIIVIDNVRYRILEIEHYINEDSNTDSISIMLEKATKSWEKVRNLFNIFNN